MFLPPTNFAVFGGHYIFRYSLQGTEIIKIVQVTFLATRKEFIVMIILESSVPGSICHIGMQSVPVFFFFLILTVPALSYFGQNGIAA